MKTAHRKRYTKKPSETKELLEDVRKKIGQPLPDRFIMSPKYCESLNKFWSKNEKD